MQPTTSEYVASKCKILTSRSDNTGVTRGFLEKLAYANASHLPTIGLLFGVPLASLLAYPWASVAYILPKLERHVATVPARVLQLQYRSERAKQGRCNPGVSHMYKVTASSRFLTGVENGVENVPHRLLHQSDVTDFVAM